MTDAGRLRVLRPSAWPLMMFPGLGKIVGAGVLVIFIALVLIS